MPNSPTHAFATVTGAFAAPAIMVSYGVPLTECLAVSTGFLLTLVINPDLDLNRQFPKRNPAKWVWWIMMLPYSRFISHRSPLSHTPVVGTVLRVVYLLILLFAIMRALGISVQEFAGPMNAIFIGMVVSDTIHFLMDIVSTEVKRWA